MLLFRGCGGGVAGAHRACALATRIACCDEQDRAHDRRGEHGPHRDGRRTARATLLRVRINRLDNAIEYMPRRPRIVLCEGFRIFDHPIRAGKLRPRWPFHPGSDDHGDVPRSESETLNLAEDELRLFGRCGDDQHHPPSTVERTHQLRRKI